MMLTHPDPTTLPDEILQRPFVGLKPFETNQAAYFFGRDRETQLVINNLIANRLTLFYAESGAGKTSLLNAGVAYELAQQRHAEIQAGNLPSQVVVIFRDWQRDPINDLLKAIDSAFYTTLSFSEEAEPTPPTQLTERIREWTDSFGVQLYLVLDQFEEYFLYPHANEQGVGSFFYEFIRLVNTPTLNVNIMLSLREDGLSRLDRFEGHIPILFNNLLRIEPLSKAAGRAAIEGPIARYNEQRPVNALEITIKPETVTAVLEDVEEGKVALTERGEGEIRRQQSTAKPRIQAPFLQLVMEQLWRREVEQLGNQELSLVTYKAMGRAEQITKEHLDTILATLTLPQQAVAATIFKHIVTASGSKIAQTKTDLLAVLGEDDEQKLSPKVLEESVEQILNLLSKGDARILKFEGERYEITHDVLGVAILAWRRRHGEREIVGRNRRRIQQLSIVTAVITAALIGAIALTVFAFQQQKIAQNERQRAEQQVIQSEALRLASLSQERLGQNDILLAQLFGLESIDRLPTLEAYSSIYAILERISSGETANTLLTLQHSGRITNASWNADGSQILTSSFDGTVGVWDAHNGIRRLALQHEGPVTSAIWNTDETRILTISSGRDGINIEVWQTENGQKIFSSQSKGMVYSALWNSDESRILIISNTDDSGVIEALDAENGASLLIFEHKEPITSARWNMDESRILIMTSNDKMEDTVEVWDAQNEARLFALEHEGDIRSAIWNADESHILTTSSNGAVEVWDSQSGNHLLSLEHEDSARPTIWNANKSYILTSSNDGIVSVWDSLTGVRILSLEHEDDIRSATWNAERSQLLTGTSNGLVSLWDVESGDRLLTLKHQGSIRSATWSQNESRIFVTSYSGRKISVETWDATDGTHLLHLEYEDFSPSVLWNPDESRILTFSDDGTAWIWNAQINSTTLSVPHGNFLIGTTWNKENSRIITVTRNKTVELWDVKSGILITSFQHKDSVHSAIWSADESKILTSSDDDTVKIWDAQNGEPLITLQHDNDVTSAIWNKDESLILTTSLDNSVRIWDAVSGIQLTDLRHEGIVTSAIWNKDESLILTTSTSRLGRSFMEKSGGIVAIWDTQSGRRLFTIQHEYDITSATWNTSESYILTISSDVTEGIVRIWNARNGALLFSLQHEGYIRSARWSIDESKILTTSTNNTTGTVKVWSLAVDELIKELCESTFRNFNGAEWRIYFLNEPYYATCPIYSYPIGQATRLATEGFYEDAQIRFETIITEYSTWTDPFERHATLAEAYPDLVADPAVYARQYAVPALWGQGRELAEEAGEAQTAGDTAAYDTLIEEATAKFREAMTLDPSFMGIPLDELDEFAVLVAAGER